MDEQGGGQAGKVVDTWHWSSAGYSTQQTHVDFVLDQLMPSSSFTCTSLREAEGPFEFQDGGNQSRETAV